MLEKVRDYTILITMLKSCYKFSKKSLRRAIMPNGNNVKKVVDEKDAMSERDRLGVSF